MERGIWDIWGELDLPPAEYWDSGVGYPGVRTVGGLGPAVGLTEQAEDDSIADSERQDFSPSSNDADRPFANP